MSRFQQCKIACVGCGMPTQGHPLDGPLCPACGGHFIKKSWEVKLLVNTHCNDPLNEDIVMMLLREVLEGSELEVEWCVVCEPDGSGVES